MINAFAIYQPFILNFNNFSNTESSMIITVRGIASFAALFLTAKFYQLFSLRVGMLVSSCIVALGFFIFGIAGNIVVYCIAGALIGLGYGLGAMVPVAIVIKRWFYKRRATALGLCGAATGISTVGFPSLLTYSIETWGLQATFCFEGVFVVVIALLSFVLVRSRPEDKGLLPYGMSENEAGASEVSSVNGSESAHDKKLDKKSWYILVPMLLCIGAMSNVAYSHLTVLMSENGFDPQVIALGIAVSGIALMLGKLAFGSMSDKVGTYAANYAFGALAFLGMVLFCLMGSSSLLMFGGMALYGFGLAFTTVGLLSWPGDLSSGVEYEKNVRRFQIGYVAGGFVFGPLPGIVADFSGGSYLPSYAFFALCTLFIIALIQLVYRKNHAVDSLSIFSRLKYAFQSLI